MTSAVALHGGNGTTLTYNELTETDIQALDNLVKAMADNDLHPYSQQSLVDSARNGNAAAQHANDRKGISWRL